MENVPLPLIVNNASNRCEVKKNVVAKEEGENGINDADQSDNNEDVD